MLQRIVRLTLMPERRDDFVEIFKTKKSKIEAFPGCISVRLIQDASNPNILGTWSVWEDDDALQAYRDSAMFLETWKTVKPMFADKAQAWSYLNVELDA